jgi:hypothetical protein
VRIDPRKKFGNLLQRVAASPPLRPGAGHQLLLLDEPPVEHPDELGLPLVHDEMDVHAVSLGYMTVAVGTVIGLYCGYISMRRRRWRRRSCS